MKIKEENDNDSFLKVKGGIMNTLYICILLFGMPNLVFSFISNGQEKVIYVAYFQLAIYTVFILLLIFRKKINMRTQIILSVICLNLLGFIGLYVFGAISLAPLFTVMSCIVAVIMLKNWEAAIVFALTVISSIIVGVLFSTGVNQHPINFETYSVSTVTWISRTINLTLDLSVIIFILATMKRYLSNSINSLTNSNKQLIDTYDRLASSEEELRKQNEELQNNREEMYRLAYFDFLTNLPNRISFSERAIYAIEECKEKNEKLAILFIDLDDFKKVNDTMGHNAGDILLKQIAERVKNVIDEKDVFARMGGDEYALMIKDFEGHHELGEKVNAILNEITKPCNIDNNTHFLSSSIGIAVYPENGLDYLELMKNADTAMYRAKASGKNNYKIFSEDMKEELDEKLKLEFQIRNALKRNEIFLFYQPMINAKTGKIKCFEALMRWQSSIHGRVSPAKFIPLLEETGLIIEYGEWAMKEALRQNKAWHDRFQGDEVICINISPIQFKQTNFTERVKEIISESGLQPKYVELEITESILIEDFYNVTQVLEDLQQFGVRIALDDFGTGYSSLSYLRVLPIDTLKIDKSFVEDINKNSSGKSIIGSIISLAHDMGLEVVAEGVETEEQKRYLEDNNCDLLQGFLMYKPMEPKCIDGILRIK